LAEGAPRILFVPVSGRYGMGEYVRASTLARAVMRRWPRAEVQFVLSRAAPYASSVSFPTTWLESSPTFHSREVSEVLEAFRPSVVVFDNAGRTAQLRAARRVGARIIFVSARRRQRLRAFRLRWMRLLDEHWIAYPALFAGTLGRLERLKLQLLGRPAVRFLDVILARAGPERSAQLLNEIGLESRSFVLVVPGGGTGARHASSALTEFEAAARALAARGIEVLYAGGGRPAAGASAPATGGAQLYWRDTLPQADLAALLAHARVVLVNGGSTLMQALACGAACVAAPISGDQPERIRRCVKARVTRAAPLLAARMEAEVAALYEDAAGREELERRVRALGLADGVEVALGALAAYLGAAPGAPGAPGAPHAPDEPGAAAASSR
jgi:ADP-heptose:LPS heptosyltransferase